MKFKKDRRRRRRSFLLLIPYPTAFVELRVYFKNMSENFGRKPYIFLLIGVFVLLLSTIVYAEAEEDIDISSTSSSSFTATTTDVATSSNATSNDNQATTTEELYVVEEAEEKNINSNQSIYLSEVKQKRITNLCANISNRLDAVINRHEQITKRLESRITKLQQQNFDTTESYTQLQEAVSTLNQAKESIKDIDNLVYRMTTSVHPQTDWILVYTTYTNTEKLVRETQTKLRTTITILKSLPSINTETDNTTTYSTEETNPE